MKEIIKKIMEKKFLIILISVMFIKTAVNANLWQFELETLIQDENNQEQSITKDIFISNSENSLENKIHFREQPESFIAFYITENGYEVVTNNKDNTIKYTEIKKNNTSDEDLCKKLDEFSLRGNSQNCLTQYDYNLIDNIGYVYVPEKNLIKENIIDAKYIIEGDKLNVLTFSFEKDFCIVSYNNRNTEIIRFLINFNLLEALKFYNKPEIEIKDRCAVVENWLKNKKNTIPLTKEEKFSQFKANELYVIFMNYYKNRKKIINDLYNLNNEKNKLNAYICMYLNILYENNYPLTSYLIRTENSLYNPLAFKKITEEERKNITEAAKELSINETNSKFDSGWSMLTQILKNSNYLTEEKTLNKEELESISVIIPNLNEISSGDIVEFYKNIISKNDVGLVVEEENKKIVIWYDKKNGITKTNLNDFENKSALFRRLLEKDLSKENIEYQTPEWDLFDDSLNTAEIKINNMNEANQKSPEKHRWIPNTGEYLELSRIYLNAYNKIGKSIITDNNYYVKLKGAYDKKNKETLRNKASSFQIAVKVQNDYEVIGTLERNYSDNGNTSSFNDYYYFKEKKTDPNDIDKIKFKMDYTGKLKNNFKYGAKTFKELTKLCIRPVSGENAWPGDDLILEFALCRGKKEILSVKAEEDYVAVYDKKMLWRANLYLDKKEIILSNIDWNDAHPWNAPPAGTTDNNTVESGKTWYGNNEWNRFYKGDTKWQNIKSFSDLMGALEPGNGGQVVSMQGTSWYYGLQGQNYELYEYKSFKRKYNTDFVKQIANAVAYDYQGWDNPFSYKRKLQEALLLSGIPKDSNGPESYIDYTFSKKYGKIDNYGKENAEAKEPYKSTNFSYPKFFAVQDDKDESVKIKIIGQKMNNDADQGGETQNAGQEGEDQNAEQAANNEETAQEANNNKESITVKIAADDRISMTRDGNEVILQPYVPGITNGVTLHPYVPGITDAISYNKEKESDNDTTAQHPGSEMAKIAMGIDCNGLVQTSHSYENNNYKATNSKTIVPVMWKKVNENVGLMSRFVNKDAGNNYVDFEGDNVTAYLISKRDDETDLKDKEGNIIYNEANEKIKVYYSFQDIIPGDIIVYYFNNKPAHIMIVSSIDDADGYGEKNKPYWLDGSAVHIIESVYHKGDNCFGVVKERTLSVLSDPVHKLNWEVWRLKK